jgi:hypothetical protein
MSGVLQTGGKLECKNSTNQLNTNGAFFKSRSPVNHAGPLHGLEPARASRIACRLVLQRYTARAKSPFCCMTSATLSGGFPRMAIHGTGDPHRMRRKCYVTARLRYGVLQKQERESD